MSPEETIPLLNDLIRTCKDGEAGYRAAEEAVEIPSWRVFSRIIQSSGPDSRASCRPKSSDWAACRRIRALYERVAGADISSKTRSLIESQWQKLKEAHLRMQRLNEKTGARFQKND